MRVLNSIRHRFCNQVCCCHSNICVAPRHSAASKKLLGVCSRDPRHCIPHPSQHTACTFHCHRPLRRGSRHPSRRGRVRTGVARGMEVPRRLLLRCLLRTSHSRTADSRNNRMPSRRGHRALRTRETARGMWPNSSTMPRCQ